MARRSRKKLSPEERKIHNLTSKLGDSVAQEMQTMTPVGLDQVILQAVKSVEDAREELEANPKYQQAVTAAAVAAEPKKALEQGLADVEKYQGAKIAYARHLLAAQGK